MGTATIPFSNVAGNNQFTPGRNPGFGNLGPIVGAGSSQPTVNNPFMPPGINNPGDTIPGSGSPVIPGLPHAMDTSSTGGMNPGTTSSSGNTGQGTGSSAANGFITNNSSYSNGENDLQKQLIDIYGKGVGGSLFELLNSMSGTDSTILQEYIQSLQPQLATSRANIGSTLGAQGVGADSSVNAIAQANLGSQFNSMVAGESANLTQSQENLTASILTGMGGDAKQEVASSGWTTFGNVMGAITGDIGAIFGGTPVTFDRSNASSLGQATNTLAGAQDAGGYGQGDSAAIQTVPAGEDIDQVEESYV